MSASDIFSDVSTDVACYRVVLQLRAKLVGGVPSDPNVITRWLMQGLDTKDNLVLKELADRTLAERFPDRQPTRLELAEAIATSDDGPSINGFKRDPETGELVYDARCMKAAIKEFANSAYPGTDWPGKTDVSKGFRKGLMSTLAERVFVDGQFIGLGTKEPDGVEERIKHVMTPMGPRSAINRVEFVERPRLEFTVKVHDDFLPQQAWGRLWQRGEDIGIGADRSRSDGQFDLEVWERL